MSRFGIDRIGQLFPAGEHRGRKLFGAAVAVGAVAAGAAVGLATWARHRNEPDFKPDTWPEQGAQGDVSNESSAETAGTLADAPPQSQPGADNATAEALSPVEQNPNPGTPAP